MKVGNLSIAGVVVLFHPKSTVINNIQTYLDDLDLLYVVDNSENELTTYFSNYFEQTNKIKYIKNNENIGLASALNIGVNKAINDNFHNVEINRKAFIDLFDLEVVSKELYELITAN